MCWLSPLTNPHKIQEPKLQTNSRHCLDPSSWGSIICCVQEKAVQRYHERMEEYWPHEFNYNDLHIAPKGFRDEELIRSGGFGQVYRGVLPTNGLQVAVKCILRETYDGVKEFIAEISSLGFLQHRNLVQIRCFRRLHSL